VAVLATRELYEKTRDICGRLDLDQALQAIVRRANTLLDGDVAYLATCDDEHRVLRMRSFENVRTDRFKALVVPYGIGLGGAVAAQRQPQTIQDYLPSRAVTHTAEIDDAAVEEGIRSGVAAPVEFESQLLAILFVAKRTPHQFSPQQVTMLSSLANAAAIAINNAQIHGRLVAAMSIHQRLMDVALDDRGPASVTATLTDLIKGPARLLDWRGATIAEASWGGETLAAPALTDLQEASLPTVRDGVSTIPIHIGGAVEGFLLARPDGQDPAIAGVAMEQATTVLSLELMKLRSAEQIELRLRGGLFAELLSYPPQDEQRLRRQANQLGCDVAAPQMLTLLRFRDPVHEAAPWQRLVQVVGTTAQHQRLPTLTVDRGDAVALLIQADDEARAQTTVRRILEQAQRAQLPPVVAGTGRIAHNLEDYPEAFAQANRAVEAAARLPALGPLVGFDDLGLHQVLLGARATAELELLARRMLDPLLSHDARRGTELIETCHAFLECHGNVEAIARKLRLHPNTIRGRISRIETLLRRPLGEARTRLDLHLALETMQLSSP